MNSQKKVNEKLFGKTNKTQLATQKIELGIIEDAIKEKQEEAKKLANTVNGYAATARDVSSGIDRAEKYYKEAKSSFEKFKNFEKAYNDILDDVDKFYNVLKRDGFKALNDFNDINEELRKYNASVKGFKDNNTEMLKAVDDWKSIPSKFEKIK